jgi:hypothetical protein
MGGTNHFSWGKYLPLPSKQCLDLSSSSTEMDDAASLYVYIYNTIYTTCDYMLCTVQYIRIQILKQIHRRQIWYTKCFILYGAAGASSPSAPVRSAYQPPASSTLLSEQTSTSHPPPANRTGCTRPAAAGGHGKVVGVVR